MADEATAPAEQEAAEAKPETVRDPQAVLKQNEELLGEIKRLKKLTKDADGFDFEKAKAALAAQEQAEQDRLKQEGEWEKLKKQLDDRHTSELKKAKTEYETLLGNLKREKLTNVLTEKGVLPDRAKYLVHELDSQIELESTEKGFSLKKIGGIGDAAEFEAMLENVKATSPFFFASSSASGSGASGSQSSGGNAKTMPKSQWDGLGVKEQAAFIKSGGNPVE